MLSVAAVLLCAVTPSADSELLGYVEGRFYGLYGHSAAIGEVFDTETLGLDFSESWSTIFRLRPTAKLHLGNDSTVVATALGEVRQGFFAQERESIDDFAAMERLYVSLHRGPIDIVAGKQLIAWGSGLVLNPTDVLNDKAVGDLAAERPGVWGALATWALNDSANVQAAAALDPNCCGAVVIGRVDQTLGLTDVAASAAWREANEQLTLGFDIKGELEVGLWAEGAWVVDRRADAESDGFLLLELGVDYSFPVFDQLYFALEWIHQGDGTGGEWVGPVRTPPNYLTSFGSTDARSLLGTNYAMLLTRAILNAQWQVQWLNLVNVRDPSGTSVAQVTWLPMGELQITAGAQTSYGEPGGEFHLRTPDAPFLPEDVRDVRIMPWLIGWLWMRAYY